MRERDDFHQLDQALQDIDIQWDSQRKHSVHDKIMREIRSMDQHQTPMKSFRRFSMSMIMFLLLCVGGYYVIFQTNIISSPSPLSTPDQIGTNADSEQKAEAETKENITRLVEAFGKKLQHVSLLAPEDVIQESIEEHYGEYISSELLTKWLEDPSSAPGRMLSSPWPDRIDIHDIETIDDEQYDVRGEIIEITSVEHEGNDAAAKYPVHLLIKHIDHEWVIDDVTVEEANNDQIIHYKNTTYGFNLTLPETWNGYDVIESEWVGNPLNGHDMETGPTILIRHPDWKEEEPRQDIPIAVITHSQWEAIKNEEIAIGAAPIPPKELGQNEQYVFALPARYNFAFLTGYEEVEEILENNNFEAIDVIKK